MPLKITTLIENSQGEHLALKHEHGICFFIETDNKKIIFDIGSTDSFIQNSKLLNVDVAETDIVVLSHGHYDHTGGLKPLMKYTKNFKLYMGDGFFNEKYAARNNSYEFLGNDFDEKYLRKNNIDFSIVKSQTTQISDSVYIVTDFKRSFKDEVINPRFVIRKDNKFVQDDFSDEVMLAVDTDKGLVIVLGCSHPGVKNMISTAEEALNKKVYAVLGGTHLVESHGESLDKSIKYLLNEPEIIGVSHCTGKEAMSLLTEAGSRYFHNRTGSSLFIE